MGFEKTGYLLPDTVLTVYCLKGIFPGKNGYPAACLGEWEEDGHLFLFFREPAETFVAGLLAANDGAELLDRITMTYRQWQGGSSEPLKIGGFLLNPPWLKKSPEPDEIAITFDAGLVFGNGTHPTTLACLKAIEIACHGGTVRTMLDLGTGTGLLALAAARCGCSRVLAVDNNLLAARTARRNVRLNDLDTIVSVVCADAVQMTDMGADLLVANIEYEVLRRIVAHPRFLMGKWFVFSGLQHREADRILAALAAMPVVILKRWRGDSIWQTIMGITACG